MDRKPKQVSGGQRQRVALGRAIVREPKVFLMDEPLSNLDANLRIQMRAEIKRLHKKLATTFIYVTHDQTEALTMGDRIVVLDKGIIQQVATPEEIYNNPKNMFVAGFIGQMNFISVILDNNKFTIEGVDFYLDDKISTKLKDKKELIIGIRAENMINGDVEVSANTDIVEMNGGERTIFFSLNNEKWSAKIPLNYEFDNNVILNLSINNMFFFDKETEENLLYKA